MLYTETVTIVYLKMSYCYSFTTLFEWTF